MKQVSTLVLVSTCHTRQVATKGRAHRSPFSDRARKDSQSIESSFKADYVLFYNYVQAKPKIGGRLWNCAASYLGDTLHLSEQCHYKIDVVTILCLQNYRHDNAASHREV